MTVVEDLKNDMPLREISRVSDISLSSLYYKEKKRRVKRLSPQIEQAILTTASERPTYGYRRVWAVLRNKGTRVNRKAVRRVLSEKNLSLPYARHKGRTKSRNLFRPTDPDRLWETDITYIPTEQGMTYLMAIKDCFTKEWQGYQYSRSCLSRDTVRAVEDAVLRAFDGEVPDGLILRTDNGPQYISQQFRSSMNLLGISLEYIQKHTPEDNGNIESFHSSLKTDYVWPYEFSGYREASVAIENAFKDYNEKTPHSSIDYLPPREFRRKFLNDKSFREAYTNKLEVKINEK
jgi:transposase InsO family protein